MDTGAASIGGNRMGGYCTLFDFCSYLNQRLLNHLTWSMTIKVVGKKSALDPEGGPWQRKVVNDKIQ